MNLLAGPLSNLLGKLYRLLEDEYKLQKHVKEKVNNLAAELNRTHIALSMVAKVPYDELVDDNPLVKEWASEAREASYDMEDILDSFLVRVHGDHQPTDGGESLIKNMSRAFAKLSIEKAMDRRDISKAITEIMKKGEGIAKKRKRNEVGTLVANYATTGSKDPRGLMLLGTKESDLVGINKSMKELEKMTLGDDGASNKEMKFVSVVGSGGLGKSTLTKLVYEKITRDMNINCKAFVSVGQNPDLKKVLLNILLDLDEKHYMRKANFNMLEDVKIIEKIQDILKAKRYFIVIDDVWEVSSWNVIKIAFGDNNSKGKIMITTRNIEVANLVPCTYEIKPLDPDSSKKLFHGRIFGLQGNCPTYLHELSDSILNKCDGVPLALITIAGLLANNECHDKTVWEKVCKAIGTGRISNNDETMKKILSLSYYDLPSNMKTCFLYLSIYPEDHTIHRDRLIWRWICEGFIQPRERGYDLFERDLFDLGKSYFDILINRSLVQPMVDKYGEIYACCVHDMILDLICYLSKEENLVTIADDIKQVVPSQGNKELRRLSLRNTTWPTNDVLHVRSIAIFGTTIDLNTPFSCFNMLRVLDLEGCQIMYFNLCVGNLIHLRYLGLHGTGLRELPTGIEKLQFLQVLKMDRFYNVEVTRSIFGLRQLICLEGVTCYPHKKKLLRNLTSLQVLSSFILNTDTAEELGYLTQLTKLEIESRPVVWVEDPSIYDTLMCLGNLPRLQSLRMVKSTRGRYFSTLPKWISREPLLHLTTLVIDVGSVRPEDIQILGMLPKLVKLDLNADGILFETGLLKKFVVSADAFPCLKFCNISYTIFVPSTLAHGAMPRVKEIWFDLRVMDFFCDDGFNFDDLDMKHLTSLQTVNCFVAPSYFAPEKEEELKSMVTEAVGAHPNKPSLSTSRDFGPVWFIY